LDLITTTRTRTVRLRVSIGLPTTRIETDRWLGEVEHLAVPTSRH
jgi:hypothetical protein